MIVQDVRFDSDAHALLARSGVLDRPLRHTPFNLAAAVQNVSLVPDIGDLVCDLRVMDAAWRVAARSLHAMATADSVGLLLQPAPLVAMPLVDDAARMHLTMAAASALAAERGVPSTSLRVENLLPGLGRAAPFHLRKGHVFRTDEASRLTFAVDERLFMWAANGSVEIRYLVDLATGSDSIH